MEESNKRRCKACGALKTRTLVGKFDKLNKKWSDETGKLWNGSVCPVCNVGRSRDNMRKVRDLRKQLDEVSNGKPPENS
jgi:hypothetical protein